MPSSGVPLYLYLPERRSRREALGLSRHIQFPKFYHFHQEALQRKQQLDHRVHIAGIAEVQETFRRKTEGQGRYPRWKGV